jgi:6-pyruvoyltetrahydropterin/6-carboxytetrahydropterin synthase
MTYRITLERNTLRFSAAHFTTFGGDCEPLHGHNYDVFVDIEGALTDDAWVLDFSEGKHLVGSLCKQLDHRFLVPLNSSALHIEERGSEYEISFNDRRYVIPVSDVAALPIDNSTAERLAEWFAEQIAVELGTIRANNVRRITVGVEEAPGQTGWFTRSIA